MWFSPPLTPFQAIIFHKNMVFPWFFHIFVEEFTEFTTNPMSKSTGFSQHDLRELHAFFEVEKTCAARLRKEMHGVVWRMEMVAVSENVHFRRSNFAGIVME
jgi:hypothetical protein